MRSAHFVLSILLSLPLTIAALSAIAETPADQQFQLASTALQNNDWTTTELALRRALTLVRSTNDIAGQRQALVQLGNLYYRQEQYQRAIVALQQALALAKTNAERGEILSLKGIVQLELGAYQQAYSSLVQAEGTQTSNPAAEARNRIALGEAYRYLGLYSRSLETLNAAKSLAVDRIDQGRALKAIGDAQFALGNYEQAQRDYQEALAVRREVGDHTGIAQTLRNLGQVAQAMGNFKSALMFYQQALLELKEMAKYTEQIAVWNDLGKLYGQQSQTQQAKEAFESAIALTQKTNGAGRVKTLINLGAFYRQTGQVIQSIESLEEAIALSRRNGDRLSEAKALSELDETRLKLRQS
jgi:tetratricopeptide (TPR) repeat protein